MTLRETESVLALVAEIESMRQQLAAALAACKLKDEALKYYADETHDVFPSVARKALAIQPDDSALKAWLGEPDHWRSMAGVILSDQILPNDEPFYAKPSKGVK